MESPSSSSLIFTTLRFEALAGPDDEAAVDGEVTALLRRGLTLLCSSPFVFCTLINH
jgi:hypothetical protein